MRLVCTSDLHFWGKDVTDLRSEKLNNLALIELLEPTAVLVAGDLTEDGYDGIWVPFKHSNQFAGLVKWIRSISVPVHICGGNHDTYVDFPYFWRPVDFHLIRTRGWLSYSRRLDPSTILVVLGENPAKNLNFLRRILQKPKYWDQTFVLMWHYNLSGNYSDWWSTEEKNSLWEVIQPHQSRIKLIVTGHIHENTQSDFHGIPALTVGGPGVTLVTWENEQLQVQVHES